MADYDENDPIYPDVPGHVRGSETSAEAAKTVKAAAMRLRVAACILEAGDGTTDDELEVLLGLPHQSASPRRRELELDGQVVGTGRKRPTRTGCKAQIYVHIDNAPPELLVKAPLPPVHLTHEQRRALGGLLRRLAEVQALELLPSEIATLRKAVVDLLGRARPERSQLEIWPAVA